MNIANSSVSLSNRTRVSPSAKMSKSYRHVRMSNLFVLAGLLVLLSAPSFFFNATAMFGGSQIGVQYAGYDVCVQGTCSVFTFPFPEDTLVKGSFVVPKIMSCPSSGLQYLNYVVEVDLRDGAGVQFGCDQFPFFFAFVKEAGTFMGLGGSFPVNPGDHMSVKITHPYSTNTEQFSMVLTDATRAWTFKSGVITDNSAPSSDAEFYAYRDCFTSSCPIPNFTPLKTSGEYVTVLSGSHSAKGSIGHWLASTSSQNLYATVYKITMTDQDTGNTLAAPSAISTVSTGFTITWKSST